MKTITTNACNEVTASGPASSPIHGAVLAILVILASTAGVHAGLPSMTDPVITVQIDHHGTTQTYSLYRDFDGDNILHVKPQALRIERDPQGRPVCRVVLISDVQNPDSQNRNVASGGWIYLQARVGYSDQDAVFEKISEALAATRPELANYTLTSISFRPDTAKLTVELGGGIEFENKFIQVPTGATTTVGGVLNVKVPLTASHAAQIEQTVLVGDGSGNDLGLNLHYEADVLYGLRPCKVTVEAKKNETFDYFQSKSTTNAGFWVFSYNEERTKIREDFKTRQLVETEIDFGDPALNANEELLQKIAERYENELIDSILNLSVDRTTQTPAAKPTIKEGRTTIYAPGFYWSYTSYFAGSYGSVDIERTLDAYAMKSFTLKKSIISSEKLASDNDFEVPRDLVREVQLDNAFDATEVAQCRNFPEAPEIYGKYLDAVNVSATLPTGENVVWRFNPNSLEDKQQVYRQDATMTKRTHQFGGDQFFTYEMTVPSTMEAEAELLAPGYTVTSSRTIKRSPDRFEPLQTTLRSFFTPFKIRGDLLFERFGDSLGGPFQVEGILHVGATNEDRSFILREEEPEAVFFFARDGGFGDGSFLRFRLNDGIHIHEFGVPVEIPSSPTADFSVVATQIGGLSDSDALLVSAEDLILFLRDQAPRPFRIKGRLKMTSTNEFKNFTLSADSPTVSIKYNTTEGLGEDSFLQFRVFDILHNHDWGPEVPVEARPTDRHDVVGQNVGGFAEFFGLVE